MRLGQAFAGRMLAGRLLGLQKVRVCGYRVEESVSKIHGGCTIFATAQSAYDFDTTGSVFYQGCR